MEDDYKTIRLSESTLSYFKDCFDNNGGKKTREHLKWQFIDNAKGEPNCTMVVHKESDITAAVASTIINPVKVGEKVLDAAQPVDLLVDRNHRSKGLVVYLGTIMQTECFERKRGLIYSFPNSQSVKAVEKYLGWNIQGIVPILIRPLKTRYFTNKVKPIRFLPNVNVPIGSGSAFKNITIKEKREFPKGVNEVWKSFSKDIKVAVQRDQKYLQWRYLDKPDGGYKILHAYGPEDNYLGYIVYAIKEKHKGSIGYIMELIYDLNSPKAGEALLYNATKIIKEAGADCILSWCFAHSPNYKVFKKRSFFQLKEKLRPIEINFAVLSILKDEKEMIENRDNWYLSYSDSDTA